MLKKPFCTYCGMEGHLAYTCAWKTLLIQCDDGIHLIDLRKGFSDFYGWVLRRHPDGLLVSVRKATAAEIVTASLRAAAISLRERTADAAPADVLRASIDVATNRFEGPAMHWAPDQSERSLGMVEPKQAEGAQGEPAEHVPDEVFQVEFQEWWEEHGIYCRSGGGDYERTFAFQAWRHLYPQLLQARAALAQPSPQCATCNDNGMIGGPSFYAPDEGGVPCPDCAQASPAPERPTHADIPRFVWGEDGMRRASSGTWIRDAWLRAIEEQHERIVGALRVTHQCTMGVGSGDGQLFVHGDHASIKAAQKIVLERDAAQAKLAELEKQEPFYYFADCDDPDYSRLYNTEGDALSQISDHGGNVVKLYAAPFAQAGQAPQAWLDVQAERRRQVKAEGFDANYDDMATRGQIARAASCYALHAGGIGTDWPDGIRNGSALFWPWDKEWWKPRTARDNLVRAGALVLAEIERLDRASSRAQGGE